MVANLGVRWRRWTWRKILGRWRPLDMAARAWAPILGLIDMQTNTMSDILMTRRRRKARPEATLQSEPLADSGHQP
eukprot:3602617-Prymnesium_polylepis.1